MSDRQKTFVQFLVDTGCLAFGEFTLKSGQISPFFVNLGEITGGPDLETLGRYMSKVIIDRVPDTTVVFGPAYKGIPIATTIVVTGVDVAQREWDICFNRKEPKDHGEGGRYVGRLPKAEDVVVIVDDVLSSGGTKLEAARAIEKDFGVRPAAVVVAVDRRQAGQAMPDGLPPIHAVVTIEDLAQWLEEVGDDPERAAIVRRFAAGEEA